VGRIQSKAEEAGISLKGAECDNIMDEFGE